MKTRAPVLLIDMLFTKNVVQDVKTHRTLFLRFCLNDKKAQRYLLHGIEQFIGANEELLSRVPHIIKALYDNDICEEEAILAWGAKVCFFYSVFDISCALFLAELQVRQKGAVA